MDRPALRALALALLAVAALAVAAATIDSTVVSDGGTSGLGAGDSGGVGAGDTEGTGFQPLAGGGGGFDIPTPCLPWLLSPAVVGLVVLAFLVAGGWAYRETGSALPAVAIVLTFGPPVAILFGVLTACSRSLSFASRAEAAAGNVSFVPPGGGGSLGGGPGGAAVSPPTALFGLFLLGALVVAVALLFTSTGDSPAGGDESAGEDEPAAGTELSGVGRAAGSAAERIESGEGEVENEVFRAWREMTALLDVPNRQSATPAEFAATAVDRGMDRDDVTELTNLFEEVRYGGFEATPDREARAVEALRNIESTYATDDAESADGRGP